MSTPTAPSPLHALTEQVEHLEALDEPGTKLGKAVRGQVGPSTLKDLLSGTWLGHPLHPLLTDLVIGSFVSASLLDVIGGKAGQPGADRLVDVGIVAYPVTALTGVTDWADAEATNPAVRRAGLVHAASNGVALTLYVLSRRARRKGRRGTGAVLGLAGSGALAVGGYLGAHLSYSQGVGVDQTTFDPGPEDWTPVLDSSQLREGDVRRVVAGETPVMVVRRDVRVHALHDRCAHRGCSLSNGEIEGDTVTCKCHGSRYSLRDGAVLRGPATVAQPVLEVRELGDRIEVRREAG